MSGPQRIKRLDAATVINAGVPNTWCAAIAPMFADALRFFQRVAATNVTLLDGASSAVQLVHSHLGSMVHLGGSRMPFTNL